MKNLVTLQQLFENSVFKIPNYQRGYSWESQHREDLLEDLESIHNKRHYTGTIVLKEENEIKGFGETYTKYSIVDGQQRITTLLIFLKIIIKELELINDDESSKIAENIGNRYIKYDGPQGNIYKLELDDDNNFYFKETIIEDKGDIERKIKSHFRLLEAKKQFEKYLDVQKNKLNEEYFRFLKKRINKITQLLVFTVYKVEDDSEVGVIFEVMNDRGKSLSQLEKVKNYLIYLTDRVSEDSISKEELIKLINYSWKENLENLSKANKSKNEDENQFLRLNFIINFYSDLSSYRNEEGRIVSLNSQLADIHKLMKKRFKNIEKDNKKECYRKIEKYVKSLKRMSYKFRDLIVPYDPLAFQEVEDENIKEQIREVSSQLCRLDIQSNVLPLLISIYERFHVEPQKLLDLMKVCEVLAFRIYNIGNYRSYTAQSTIYSLSNDIYNSRIGFDDIIRKIKEIILGYVSDENIEGYLTDRKRDYYDWNGLRYFLYECERKRCSEETKRRPAFEWDNLKKRKKEDSIEHILPRTIYDKNGKPLIIYWTNRFTQGQHRENVKRLGNLALSTKNSSLQNKGFDEKKRIYKNSSWQIERDLATDKFVEWSEKEINEREKELVKFAKERWKV